jgi:molybdate transport system substrate-binding protein
MVRKQFKLIFIGIFLGVFHLQAVELQVMSAGAVEPGLVLAVAQYTKTSGHQVKIRLGTAPQLAKLLADQPVADLLIAPVSLINEQIHIGTLVTEKGVLIGKVGAGVTVRKALKSPQISTVESFKDVLLQADSLVYNQASTGNYLAKLFEKLGMSEQLQGKTKRFVNGDLVMEQVIHGTGNEIGFGAITEIKMFESKGLKYVGPLPRELQNYTTYSAGVMKSAKYPNEARDFLAFLGGSAKPFFEQVGIE